MRLKRKLPGSDVSWPGRSSVMRLKKKLPGSDVSLPGRSSVMRLKKNCLVVTSRRQNEGQIHDVKTANKAFVNGVVLNYLRRTVTREL
jgi:hypothetical protein